MAEKKEISKKIMKNKKTETVNKPKDKQLKAEKKSGKFAVIKTGGKQYIVREGEKILVEKLPVGENKKVEFKEIFLVSSGIDLKLGNPTVKDAVVVGIVLAVKKTKKVIVFKMKAKKRYRKTQGHRQTKAEVLIDKI